MVTKYFINDYPTHEAITRIAPFTARAGDTYLTILENLSEYIGKVIKVMNDLSTDITSETQDLLLQAQADIEAQLSAQDANVSGQLSDQNVQVQQWIADAMQQVNDAIESVLNADITVSDALVATVVGDPTSETVGALDLWVAPKVSSVQDSVNDLDQRVTSDIDSVSTSVTDLTGRVIALELDEGLTHVAEVHRFGAVGDGETDDTQAIQLAVDALSSVGGGMLVFDNKRYKTLDMVHLTSNISIMGNDATIVKNELPIERAYIAFTALGGSGWIENISISGMNFEGNLPVCGVMALWAHRLNGLKVTNITSTDSVTNGHVFDLQGCHNVLIESSTFSGSHPMPGREFVEAIQVDVSALVGSPAKDISTEIYDGTPTENVTVRGCKFVMQSPYRAPRAIGSHSAVANRMYRNIRLLDSYIETPNEALSFKGVVNIYATESSIVRGNVFNILPGLNFERIVEYHNVGSWIRQSDVNLSNPTFVPSTNPMHGLAVDFAGNEYPTGYAQSHNDYITPEYTSDFKEYSSLTAPRVYVNDRSVMLSGVVGKNSAVNASGNNITTAEEVLSFTIPPEISPKRAQRFICGGSGNSRFMLTVSSDGSVSMSRYDGTGTNPYLTINGSWDRK